MDKTIFKNISEYLTTLPDLQARRLQELREVIRKAVPEAEETISYNMPAFRAHGRILVYFAAFKEHVSLFPGNSTLISQFKKELEGYSTTKGTIHFDLDKPVPSDLVQKMVQIRAKENLEKSIPKKKKA